MSQFLMDIEIAHRRESLLATARAVNSGRSRRVRRRRKDRVVSVSPVPRPVPVLVPVPDHADQSTPDRPGAAVPA